MARIAGVDAHKAGVRTKLAYFFTRRGLAQLTGQETATGIEPVELLAHLPKLLQAYGGLEQATAKLDVLDPRTKALAELRSATLTNCEYCIDLGSQVSRRWGLSDDELLALANYRTSPLFSDLDKLVLDFATGVSRTPVDVPDALFDQLRRHFDEPQLVALTYIVALGNFRGRFNLGLGVESAGFSEGMVCALPAPAPAPRSETSIAATA